MFRLGFLKRLDKMNKLKINYKVMGFRLLQTVGFSLFVLGWILKNKTVLSVFFSIYAVLVCVQCVLDGQKLEKGVGRTPPQDVYSRL